ncbi:MAG: glycosyltransferase family 39 protein [bacterium]
MESRKAGIWKQGILLALALKLAALVCLYAGWGFMEKKDWEFDSWMTRPDTSFVENLANFDGAWFIRLGVLGPQKLARGDYDPEKFARAFTVMDRMGYRQGLWPPEEGKQGFRGYGYRHWPLFYWMAGAAYRLGLDPLWSAVLLSNFLTILYGAFLYVLARKDLGQTAAVFCVALSQFHPGAYSLSAAYNESLFLALAAGSMLSARDRRWWAAGLLAMFAASSRIFGVVLAAPLLYEWMEQRAARSYGFGGYINTLGPDNLKHTLFSLVRRPLVWWIFLVPLGFVGVLIYYEVVAGDALIWTRVHEQNVHGQVGWPWEMMIQTYKKGWATWTKELPLHAALLAVIVLSFRRVRGAYWVWMVLFFFFHTSNSNHSYLRYQVQCLPMFIAVAALVEDKPWLRSVLLCLSAALFGLFAAMFVNAYWVA